MAAKEMFALGGSTLNPFLFSEVGTEASGETLRVVSLLARQGKDPWQEAARLAAMPADAAVACLGGAIAVMPASPWSLAAATVIAARLVTALPAPLAARMTRPRAQGAGWGMPRNWTSVAVALLLLLGALAVRFWPGR